MCRYWYSQPGPYDCRIPGSWESSKKLPKMPREMPVGGEGKFWRGAHPLFCLGIGMVRMHALRPLLPLTLGWGSTTLYHLRHGRPRPFPVDAFIGPNEARGAPSQSMPLTLQR